MITTRTVLVLGAGASKPYGLPLGSELRDEVLRAAQNVAYKLHLRRYGLSKTDFEKFAEDLATSGFSSVDAFLEQRPEWTNIGKLAMALSLLSSEYGAIRRLFPPHQPKDHWYEVLWSYLKASSWQSFKKQPLSIVTFNYDRSLEHYLVQIMCNNYSVKPHSAVAGLPILHVHGTLGAYDPSKLGRVVDDGMPGEAARSIRVVHEADVEQSEFVRARQLIGAADRVLFIGFGYLDTNMRKLGYGQKADSVSGDPVIIAGTHKGFKSRAWEGVCHRYKFSAAARTHGGGSMSEFVADWLS